LEKSKKNHKTTNKTWATWKMNKWTTNNYIHILVQTVLTLPILSWNFLILNQKAEIGIFLHNKDKNSKVSYKIWLK